VHCAALITLATLVERCCVWSDLRRTALAVGGVAHKLVPALVTRLEAHDNGDRSDYLVECSTCVREQWRMMRLT
jgi:hypothetical protein